LSKKECYIQKISITSIENILKTIVGMPMIFMGGMTKRKF
jgi:hypothetical protein